MLVTVLLGVLTDCSAATDWEDTLNLPVEHVAYLFYQRPALREQCLSDPDCLYKEEAEKTRCFGYEDGCPVVPPCRGDSRDPAVGNQQSWRGADFGFVKTRKKEMRTYCTPEKEDGSELRCSGLAQICLARRLYVDLRRLIAANSRPAVFREETFLPGEFGGRCLLKKNAFHSIDDRTSVAQSWFAELKQFSSLFFEPDGDKCDLIIERPVLFIKLDYGYNMYHHFCNIVNLYASLHVNGTWPDSDVQLVTWETSRRSIYRNFFSEMWQVFSKHPILTLSDWDGKRVCFRDVMFALPPRMRPTRMRDHVPLMQDCCSGTGLMRAFSQHVLHRLGVTQDGLRRDGRLRVTFLERKAEVRNVLNQEELLKALNDSGAYEVRVVAYNHQQKLVDQLQSTHNTDIFIGMHGAGLTHLLFLPDWATVFEMYNCTKPSYLELSQLRGIPHFTWEKMDLMTQLGEGYGTPVRKEKEEKKHNYAFDVDEFARIVDQMAQHVRSHPAFEAARREQKDEL